MQHFVESAYNQVECCVKFLMLFIFFCLFVCLFVCFFLHMLIQKNYVFMGNSKWGIVNLYIYSNWKEICHRKVSHFSLIWLWFVLSFSAAGGDWSYNLKHKYGILLFALNFATFPFALKNMTNICKSDWTLTESFWTIS